jgi:hypothetical protein
MFPCIMSFMSESVLNQDTSFIKSHMLLLSDKSGLNLKANNRLLRGDV